MAVVEYTNLAGPVETGAYDPQFIPGVVGYSPKNNYIYVRGVPEVSNLANGAPHDEGAVQIVSEGQTSGRIIKLLGFLYEAYRQEADYDPTETLVIESGTVIDERIYADNTGYLYTHVETSINGTPQHYMMTSQDNGETWIGYRLPQNTYIIMEHNSRPIR